MKELSLHILDIIQNAIAAEAVEVHIEINEDLSKDLLEIIVSDNGFGMDEEFVRNVTDPFTTTRKTRKVGLGIPLFKASALQCDGDFKIKSKLGQGTTVHAMFKHSHIDRPPIGKITDTIITCILSNDNIDFKYIHRYNQNHFIFNTKQIKSYLDGVSISDYAVINWMKDYIEENLTQLVKF
ncbi:ATP-binding protein [Serpentinicella sp. ANB-PHB4]|uniref:ATP-binding protein n=1 Tax=Serpentinicella sp. ANB-PHB4 TaxID=3074076 RepID=UPI002863269A|nr:ATP-binding protein [Serpentinicella sp. ANB-PHB4]MDR5657876.1 ATP-binding protein [Serpentinicella sp. ANB-PHB4]